MNASARGFTLVEMLLAMVITATVAAAAMTALDQLTDADARATQHIESTVGVYRALQTLRRDLADCKGIRVTAAQVAATRADGTVVVYTIQGGGTELHRNVVADILLVPMPVDLLDPVGYGPRGHIRDGDYRADAVIQGAGDISFTVVTGPRTGANTGVKVRIVHATSHGKQAAEAIGMCWHLVEIDAKP